MSHEHSVSGGDDLDLLYTDVEEALRASVRDLLRSRSTPERVLACYDGDHGLTAELWPRLAVDLGLAGLLVPEHLGGAGATAREAAVVLEELGRAVTPVPFLTSAVVATTALAGLGGAGSVLLEQLAAGERTAALAVPFTASASDFRSRVVVHDGTLTGWVPSVAGASEADVLLVPAASPDGMELYRVDATRAGVTPMVSLDMTRPVADVDLTNTTAERLAGIDLTASVVPEALCAGAALLASEQLGVAEWCLWSTVTYLRERTQFGRAVGGFQALKHRLADVYVAVESARAAARYAAATRASGDPDQEVAAVVAQAYCSSAALTAAEECVQLHGGIGMTWEHPAHLYLKRAKADQLALGTPEVHRRRLSELVDLTVSSVAGAESA